MWCHVNPFFHLPYHITQRKRPLGIKIEWFRCLNRISWQQEKKWYCVLHYNETNSLIFQTRLYSRWTRRFPPKCVESGYIIDICRKVTEWWLIEKGEPDRRVPFISFIHQCNEKSTYHHHHYPYNFLLYSLKAHIFSPLLIFLCTDSRKQQYTESNSRNHNKTYNGDILRDLLNSWRV